jgi:nitroreductase
MLKELILKNRSYRRFDQNHKIKLKILEELIDLARLSPSGANLQPLKYILSVDTDKNSRIFKHLAWAGYLTDWPGPAEGERPAGYIIILLDTDIQKKIDCDHGIAAQSMLLGAAELGLGGCIIGSVQRDKLRAELGFPARFEILLVIALGKPVEEVVLEQISEAGNIRYWRDEDHRHHVPKRPLEELILPF